MKCKNRLQVGERDMWAVMRPESTAVLIKIEEYLLHHKRVRQMAKKTRAVTPPLKTSLWDSGSVYARSDFVWYTAGLTLVEENEEWREAGLSPKWGTVARTRERSVINTAQTNYTPYRVPSRLPHSKTTRNMPTIDLRLHTGSHGITHPHTWLPVCYVFFFFCLHRW